jgi:hypothetical protein
MSDDAGATERVQSEREKALGHQAQLVHNVPSMVDASVWLVAGGEYPSALVILADCIEIVLKAELESIHRLLIADTRSLKFEDLKELLRDAFQAHPRGRTLAIQEPDIDRTIAFDEAVRRVKGLWPGLEPWAVSITDIHKLRNAIVHYGADRALDGEYVRRLCCDAIPFLRDALRELFALDLDGVLGPVLARELRVARETCKQLARAKEPPQSWALHTVGHLMRNAYHSKPELVDERGWLVDQGTRQFDIDEQWRLEVEKHWDMAYVELSCALCDHFVCYVKVDHETSPRRRLIARAVACPGCGLVSSPARAALAEVHVGEISSEATEKYLADIGE